MALNDFVRRVKNALTGAEQAPASARSFEWEPPLAEPSAEQETPPQGTPVVPAPSGEKEKGAKS